MQVLVTGASGYIGGRLCHTLLRHGHNVRAFVRPTNDLSFLPTLSDDVALERAYGDTTNYHSLHAACLVCNVIFHAADCGIMASGSYQIYICLNLQGYKETDTIEKIIYTYSFFALGPTDGYIADETHGLPGYFCRNHLPKNDGTGTLIDEEGDEYPTVYLACKMGLSGGWMGFFHQS